MEHVYFSLVLEAMGWLSHRMQAQGREAMTEPKQTIADAVCLGWREYAIYCKRTGERIEADNGRLRAELARIRGLPRLAALDDEIKRLRATIADLTAAIQPLAEYDTQTGGRLPRMVDFQRARAALAKAEKP